MIRGLTIIFCCLYCHQVLGQNLVVHQHKTINQVSVNDIIVYKNEVFIGTENNLYPIKDFHQPNVQGICAKGVFALHSYNEIVCAALKTNELLLLNWAAKTHPIDTNQLPDLQVEEYRKLKGVSKNGVIHDVLCNNSNIFIASSEKFIILPYDTNANQFIQYKTMSMNGFEEDNINFESALRLHEGYNRQIWLGTSSGLFTYKDERLNEKAVFKKKAVHSIAEHKGDIWFVAGNNIYFIKKQDIAKSNLSLKKHKIILPENLIDIFINDILIDSLGRVWLAGADIYLMGKEEGSNTLYLVRQLSDADGFTSNDALCLAIDKQENIWVGTAGKGLFIIEPEKISPPDSVIAQNTPTTLDLVDKEHFEAEITQPKNATGNQDSLNGQQRKPIVEGDKTATNSEESKAPKTEPIIESDPDSIPATEPIPESEQYTTRDKKTMKGKVIKGDMLRLTFWDAEYNDGDAITVEVNDSILLEHYVVTKKKETKKFDLTALFGEDVKQYELVIHSADEGTRPQNTVKLQINSNLRKDEQTLRTTKNQSVKMTLTRVKD